MESRNVASRGTPASASLALALLASAVLSCTVTHPCAAESPSFRGSWPPNRRGMPAYARVLPPGKNKLDVKNPFHFRVVVQVRSGNQGRDFVMEGKSSKELLLPDGEYTAYYRCYYDLRVHEGRSFTAMGGQVTFDDEDEEKGLAKTRDRRTGKRKSK